MDDQTCPVPDAPNAASGCESGQLGQLIERVAGLTEAIQALANQTARVTQACAEMAALIVDSQAQDDDGEPTAYLSGAHR